MKTDQQFDFVVGGPAALDLTVDFDLSRSIVATGGGAYHLKPVLHLNQTAAAAAISGSIAAATFGAEDALFVTVSTGGEVYTELLVDKESAVDPTVFQVFWLVPGHAYVVLVEKQDGTPVFEEAVAAVNLPAGGVFVLNSGDPI